MTAALVEELQAMRSELTMLRAKVAELESTAQRAEPVTPSSDPPAQGAFPTSRRRLLALAGGAAGAAVAATTVLGARPAAAALGDGTPVPLADNAISNSTNVSSTFLNYAIPTTNTQNRNLFVAGDVSVASTPAADKTAAVSGYAGKTVKIGVTGYSTVSGGKGVYGHSVSGVGVQAESDQSWSLQVGGTGRVYLAAAAPAGPPTTGSFSTGELVRDGNADFWVCTVGGAAPQWRKLAFDGAAGPLQPQLHIIEPTRVYDSRLPLPGTKLASDTSRTISVANGIDLNTGVASVPDVVPAGAAAVQFTLTVDSATNSGFLAATPGGSAGYKASTINWTETTTTIATGGLCKLDASRQLTIYAGGGGAAHFLVDITGYYI
jgi:hypothetical protein